ncbi:MAG: radical SAM family heme chaperone HemW [Propionibacteriaceae bacterium]|nr:radical SAM family heme chaperone HemW [Propionibacteriaceae bacterium]
MTGVYVHIPFCHTRCGYCDFHSQAVGTRTELFGEYVEQLLARISRAGEAADAPVDTIFFGGGTPTLLAPALLGAILDGIRAAFDVTADAEITTEANPESVEPQTLVGLRRAGFNRISFGMQSADEQVLRALDRRHTPNRVPQVVQWAREAGFHNLSVDLIYGTPGETDASWRHTLEAAIALAPEHISAYALTIEPGTPMYVRMRRGELPDTDPDAQADRYLLADELLTAAGYANYEISNWAKPGFECRHNLNYWLSGNWYGFGISAHSHFDGVRAWETGEGISEERLTAEQRRTERVLLETRLATGLPLEVLTYTERARLPGLVERGLAVVTDRLVLTARGRLLSDAIIRDLLD